MTIEATTSGHFDAEIHKIKGIVGSKQSSINCQIKCIGNRHSFATADIDVRFAATAKFTSKVSYKYLSSRKNVVQCWKQL